MSLNSPLVALLNILPFVMLHSSKLCCRVYCIWVFTAALTYPRCFCLLRLSAALHHSLHCLSGWSFVFFSRPTLKMLSLAVCVIVHVSALVLMQYTKHSGYLQSNTFLEWFGMFLSLVSGCILFACLYCSVHTALLFCLASLKCFSGRWLIAWLIIIY